MQNAVDLAPRAHGACAERVWRSCSAMETVNPTHTLDHRGRRALQDGGLRPDHGRVARRAARPWTTPLSPEAAAIKNIVSPAAGRANVLIVLGSRSAATCWPKACRSSPSADAAGNGLGARVPIVLTSRADARRRASASRAVAALGRGPASPRAP